MGWRCLGLLGVQAGELVVVLVREQQLAQEEWEELKVGEQDWQAMRHRWGLQEVRRCSSSSYIRLMMDG